VPGVRGLCCTARRKASSRVMCAEAFVFCAGETEVGVGLAGGASCAEADDARASSPAAKATTILIVKIPLGSVPKRRMIR